MMQEGLYAYITADAGVKAILGSPRSDGTTGVFPSFAPDECLMPHVVLLQISGLPLQESFAGTGRLQESHWRFSCYGSTYKQAKQLAQAVMKAMISCNGVMPAGSVEVHGSWWRLEIDEAEPIPHGTIYSTHVDFDVNFSDNS
jgi:hypothetical protein